ncbi:transmembrane protein 223 [Lampris incognitus]|uniref:transmembrane protein 223 n=1 Tax=Lampris incognitus TaxID=2546036 RepID=UPI0024B50208|nr:transmembrane protein 223 [Lampris incognitus]
MGFHSFLSKVTVCCSSMIRFRLFNISQNVDWTRRGIIQQTSPGHVSSRTVGHNIHNGPTCLTTGSAPNPVLMGLRSGGFHYSSFVTPLCQRTPARRWFSTSAQVWKDVVLFEHDRSKFFRLLAIFCGCQFLFWTYLAHFAYTGLRNTGSTKEQHKQITTGLAGFGSFEMNMGSSAWKYGFTLGCLAIGGGIVGLGSLFCLRSVSQVMLHKGGRMVTVTTQSPLGLRNGRKITVPLSQIACYAHREETPSFIPLRVRGYRFYFLLDKDGTINNAKLFDITVGAYRTI